MFEGSKPEIVFYGLVLRKFPVLAIGIESKVSAVKRVDELMEENIKAAKYFSKIDIRRPPERYQIAIGILGQTFNLFKF